MDFVHILKQSLTNPVAADRTTSENAGWDFFCALLLQDIAPLELFILPL